MVIVTREPAGITTRPDASITSLATDAVTVAPGLSVFELISRSIVVARVVAPPSASGAGAGAGFGLGLGVGFGWGAGFGAGAGTGAAAIGVAPAWPFKMADESTRSRCKSR